MTLPNGVEAPNHTGIFKPFEKTKHKRHTTLSRTNQLFPTNRECKGFTSTTHDPTSTNRIRG